MKKVLVTGATGFIGNYVVKELLRSNCKVIASSSHRDKASLKEWFSDVDYRAFDLSDFNTALDYYNFFGKPDILIHLAWEGLPNYKASFHLEQNLPRHFAFLENMIQHGLKSLTVTGTCFEYGMQEGCLTEEMEVYPANPYAIAKNTLREKLQQLEVNHPFSLRWVRLFYMYGKGQNPNSLLSQLSRALENKEEVFNMSGGEQMRDFLPVEKVADYIVKIAMQEKVKGIINCCSGKPVTVLQLVEEYMLQNNKNIKLNLGFYPYPDYEPMHFWGDCSKLNRIFCALRKDQ